jgi:glycosyltransferase involved in cell wall biosynthesis
LLSPNKGIEIMLDAMPGIIRSCPNAVYVILGATHPNLVRDHGEAYRDSLTSRVQELGIGAHVAFFNQFVDQATLLNFIAMCDVYVTPYLNEAQMTSGTLAYSFGLGKAVVSTPYWHAKELLGDGRGILVPFGDADALSGEISGLLTNEARRQAMRKRAYAASRSMTWMQTAKRYLAAFETAHENVRPGISSLTNAIGLGRRCVSDISSRSATVPASSSIPSTRCQIGRMAIVSTTTPAPCCSLVPLRNGARRHCRRL